MAEPVVIKKYGNRRLYDTGSSLYVNLDDIGRLVREGKEVRVVDAKTGEDLTRVVLTQLILEDAREKRGELPLELLVQMVRASGRAMREMLSWYEAMLPMSLIGGRPATSQAAGDARIADLNRTIEELRARVTELEQRGGQAPRGTPRRRKAR